MTIRIALPPESVPLTGKDGRITREWLACLQALQRRANAESALGSSVAAAPDQAAAQTALGLAPGVDVMAFGGSLETLEGLEPDAGAFIVGDGADWVTKAEAQARAALGLGTAAVVNTGTSGDTVPKNDTANTFSAEQVIDATNAGGAQLTVRLTDEGSQPPTLLLEKASGSPAPNDVVGQISLRGRNSAGATVGYCVIRGHMKTPTAGVEDGVLRLQTYGGGTLDTRFNVGLGLYYGGGADMGAGAIHATALYETGIAISAKYQALDSDLTALAANGANGFWVRTGSGTGAARSIAAGTGIAVTNGDGVAGNPMIAISDPELLALAGLSSAADKLPYFTGSGSAAVTGLSAFARTLLDDPIAGQALVTLGVGVTGASLFVADVPNPARATLFGGVEVLNSDTNSNFSPANGPNFATLETTSLTANRNRNLQTTNAVAGDIYEYRRVSSDAFARQIKGSAGNNLGPAVPVGITARFLFDGTAWIDWGRSAS